MAKDWEQFNCYKVLGIPPTASPQEIRSAWRQASLKSHPDHGGSHDAQVKVNLAYEVLSDPISRQSHDIFWASIPSASTPTSRTTTYRPSATTYNQPRPQPPSGTKSNTSYAQPRRESLTGLRSKIAQQVEKEKGKIWADLGRRKISFDDKFAEEATNQRQGIALRLLAAIGLGIGGIYISSWFYLGAIYFGFQFLSSISNGIHVGNRHFSVFSSLAEITKYAHEFAQESCKTDEANLSKYFSILARISELLMRSSDFDDSEEQVARRLTAAFFLMGYTPYQYDKEKRMLVFTVAEEKIAVRFRHRSGIATNITFVEKFVDEMRWDK